MFDRQNNFGYCARHFSCKELHRCTADREHYEIVFCICLPIIIIFSIHTCKQAQTNFLFNYCFFNKSYMRTHSNFSIAYFLYDYLLCRPSLNICFIFVMIYTRFNSSQVTTLARTLPQKCYYISINFSQTSRSYTYTQEHRVSNLIAIAFRIMFIELLHCSFILFCCRCTVN